MSEITFAEIEAREFAEHEDIALQRWFVEAVELLELLDLLRVDVRVRAQAEAAAIAFRLTAPQIMHGLLDRSVWHELDHDESERQYADERRDHQENAFKDVAPHGASSLLRRVR